MEWNEGKEKEWKKEGRNGRKEGTEQEMKEGVPCARKEKKKKKRSG